MVPRNPAKSEPEAQSDARMTAESPPKNAGQNQINWQANLISRCDAHARETGQETRAMKPDPAVGKALDEQAEIWALAAIPSIFNPDADPFDKRVMFRLKDMDEARADHLAQAAVCVGDKRTRDEDLARLGPLPPFPAAPVALRWTAIIGTTFSLGAVLHDLIPGLAPALRWSAAAGVGGSFATFIVSAALPDIAAEETHGQLTLVPLGNKGVFLAGFTTSIAFFAARIALCRSRRDLLLAAGTALSEVGILFYIKIRGAGLHEERNAWAAKRDARLRAEHLRDVAQQHEERHLAKAAEIGKEIARLEQENLIDRVRGVDKQAVIAMAVKAMRAGYLAQIAINRGSGVPPKGEKKS